jgi:hypothetical protein
MSQKFVEQLIIRINRLEKRKPPPPVWVQPDEPDYWIGSAPVGTAWFDSDEVVP